MSKPKLIYYEEQIFIQKVHWYTVSTFHSGIEENAYKVIRAPYSRQIKEQCQISCYIGMVCTFNDKSKTVFII